MSNGELLKGLLGMVRFSWIARILHKMPKYKNIAQNCPNITQIAQNCLKLPKLFKIAEYCTSAQGTPHPEYGSFNHCHHPTPYSQQKRMAYSASTFSTPIILFFVASRSSLMGCQSNSVIVAICSLKSHRSRF